MNILEQYKKERPEAFQPQTSTPSQESDNYGFFVRFVMQISGGKITQPMQALYILGSIALLAFIASLVFFFGIPGIGQKTISLPCSLHPTACNK